MLRIVSHFDKLSNPEVVFEINELASMFEYTRCVDINSLYKRAMAGMINLQDYNVIEPELEYITDVEYRKRSIEDYDIVHFSDDPLIDLSNLNNNLSQVFNNLNKRKFFNSKKDEENKPLIKKDEENKVETE